MSQTRLPIGVSKYFFTWYFTVSLAVFKIMPQMIRDISEIVKLAVEAKLHGDGL